MYIYALKFLEYFSSFLQLFALRFPINEGRMGRGLATDHRY
jgi:hypothetical protein